MAAVRENRDKHVPLWAHDWWGIRKRLGNPGKYGSFVSRGQVAADLGCGTGHYTFGLAEAVGPEGKVFAVDSDDRAIRRLRARAERGGVRHIDAHACSAHDMGFIAPRSVDFVLARGLLCSMAPRHHESAVSEIHRILKPGGRAYLSAARGMGYVDSAEWERILEGFRVERRNGGFPLSDRWAVVSPRA